MTAMGWGQEDQTKRFDSNGGKLVGTKEVKNEVLNYATLYTVSDKSCKNFFSGLHASNLCAWAVESSPCLVCTHGLVNINKKEYDNNNIR
jgi:hypothetical protein